MLVAALTPYIGYDRASSVAKEALGTHRTVREIVLAGGLMDVATLDLALDPVRRTRP